MCLDIPASESGQIWQTVIDCISTLRHLPDLISLQNLFFLEFVAQTQFQHFPATPEGITHHHEVDIRKCLWRSRRRLEDVPYAVSAPSRLVCTNAHLVHSDQFPRTLAEKVNLKREENVFINKCKKCEIVSYLKHAGIGTKAIYFHTSKISTDSCRLVMVPTGCEGKCACNAQGNTAPIFYSVLTTKSKYQFYE